MLDLTFSGCSLQVLWAHTQLYAQVELLTLVELPRFVPQHPLIPGGEVSALLAVSKSWLSLCFQAK